MKGLTFRDVCEQSKAVYGQFGEKKWKPFSKENANHPLRRDPNELKHCGVGKILVSAGMGSSLESQVDILKKYRNKYDLITCDKGFRALLEHGIKADYVMICDCNILWQKWAPNEADTVGVKLISTPYGNVDWTRKWRGPIYFYLNRDAIKSEEIFADIIGTQTRMVPASSNVGNAQVVFMIGVDEYNTEPFAGYERIYLVGYDYSWPTDGNYYAWSNPIPKRHYMTSRTVVGIDGKLALTSENLVFSAKWLKQYIQAIGAPVYNCTPSGLLCIELKKLETELFSFDPSLKNKIRSAYGLYLNARTMLKIAENNVISVKEGLFNASR